MLKAKLELKLFQVPHLVIINLLWSDKKKETNQNHPPV